MARKKLSDSAEFKHDAAKLVLDNQHSVQEACTAMGVGYTAMRRWVRQLEAERAGATPSSAKAITPEHRNIQALEARIRQVEWENDILKKATALLMSDSIRR